MDRDSWDKCCCVKDFDMRKFFLFEYFHAWGDFSLRTFLVGIMAVTKYQLM